MRSASSKSRQQLTDPEVRLMDALQAVTIVEGKKSVDVGVTLCYCNEDLCNEELSGASTTTPGLTLLLSVVNILILSRFTQ